MALPLTTDGLGTATCSNFGCIHYQNEIVGLVEALSITGVHRLAARNQGLKTRALVAPPA